MADHQGEDKWVAVYPGDDFPAGAVRAMNRGLACKEHGLCDAYVALWIRDDGEAVFGTAANEKGKAVARFPWGGKVVSEKDTKGFRILTYIGPGSLNKFKYNWVRASRVDTNTLLYVGQYVPAVVDCSEGGEVLGKADPVRKMAWTCAEQQEMFHQGDEFMKAHLLCRVCTEKDDDE